MNSGRQRHGRLLVPFLVVSTLMGGGTLAGGWVSYSAWAAGASPYPAWDTLARAFYAVRTRYVDEVEESKLVYAALEGLTEALDPHSGFFDPRAYESLRDQEKKRYFGIGTQVVSHALGIEITGIVPGSPAELAGLRGGDIITSVDGSPVGGLRLELAASKLEGPRGQPMQLEVARGKEKLSFRVVRDLVNIPAVRGELLAGNKVYIAIEEFRQGSGDELREMLRELQRRNKDPLEVVVIDLRDNPGGILDEAVKVVDAFTGEATVAEVRDRTGRASERYLSHTEADDLDVKVAVLINGGSASGSEIVAGALRDLEGATIVGTPSYGKGSVQTYWEFEDHSALKLTIGRYVLPKGEIIEPGKGLLPDVEVLDREETARRALVRDLQDRVGNAPGLRDNDRQELSRILAESHPALTGMDIDARLNAVAQGQDLQLLAALAALERAPEP